MQKSGFSSIRTCGSGATVTDSFGNVDFYTTVDGDSFDSLGYECRSTTAQLLRYKPSLVADKPIPAGTKVNLMAGEQRSTAPEAPSLRMPRGVPLTYTTAPGDIETQIVLRFGLTGLADLASANRPLVPGAGVWYESVDPPSGELAAGQTISLALDKPINK